MGKSSIIFALPTVFPHTSIHSSIEMCIGGFLRRSQGNLIKGIDNKTVRRLWIRDGTRNYMFLVHRGPGHFFHSPIPWGIDFITSRLLEVLDKYRDDLANWKISSFLRTHLLPGTFFTFAIGTIKICQKIWDFTDNFWKLCKMKKEYWLFLW